MLELVMKTDMAKAIPERIDFNFEELKAELAERLDHYNKLIVTEDGIKEAKEDRAKLNRLRTAIDTRRKDVKKEYLKPYNDFEGKIKEITLLIDKPIGAIDEQLAEFEEKRKAEKLEQCKAMYEETIAENIKQIVPFDRIADKKWLNATTAMAKVQEDLDAWNKRVNSDMLVLDTIEPEYKAAVNQKYIETLDISAAIAHREALKSAAEAFKAREEERLVREEKARQEAEKKAQEAIPAPEEPQVVVPKLHSETLYNLVLQFTITKAQAAALKEFILENNIQYKQI